MKQQKCARRGQTTKTAGGYLIFSRKGLECGIAHLRRRQVLGTGGRTDPPKKEAVAARHGWPTLEGGNRG